MVCSRLVWVGSVLSLVLGASNACSSGEQNAGGSGGSAGGTAAGGAGNSSGSGAGNSSDSGAGGEGEASGGESGASSGSGAGGLGADGGSNTNGGSAGLTSRGGADAGGAGADAGGAGADAGGAGGAGGDSTSGGAGTTGGANTTGGVNASGGKGTTGGASTTGGAGGGASCGVSQEFQPETATVYLMVDRSGSMFDCLSTTAGAEPSCPDASDTAWTKLKTAALSVIQERQAQVRFGFAAFTGNNPLVGGNCPIIDKLGPQLNNFAAIKTLYDGLPFQPAVLAAGQKFETPTRQSLDLIGAALLADPAPGKKYILLVTDGQPDYCDDGNTLCAPDSVVAGLQDLYAKGITTLVMGIQSSQFDLPPSTLQAFANAGVGESTKAPLRSIDVDTMAFYDQCNGVGGWHADLVKSGKTAVRGVTLGSYSANAGPTTPYTPSVSDSSALVGALGAALSNVKSCSIDLSVVYGKPTQVDSSKVNQVEILVNNAAVAYNASSGWSLPSAGVLSLNGATCTAFRTPTGRVALNFPCDTLIFQ